MRKPLSVSDTKVVRLSPERRLARAAKACAADDTGQCSKCGSTFVAREPAFVHCRYCGRMVRLAGGSLLEQQLFELRAGLRIAS